MREIKFRAWDERYGRMLEVISINFKLKVVKVIPIGSINRLDIYETSIDEIELMQYSGRKDRNKKEVYKGDIVNIYFWDSEEKKDKLETEAVEIIKSEGCFGFISNITKRFYPLCNLSKPGHSIMVIGNINDNLNIIKGNQNES